MQVDYWVLTWEQVVLCGLMCSLSCCPQVGLTIMMISVVGIGIIASVAIGGSILTVLSPSLMAIGALMPFIGYTFGYIISSLFRLDQS